jgi:LysM repeat protein
MVSKESGDEGAEGMAATIGIKVANGAFYPIIEEKTPVKKRLVLTTVHDRQTSVQIDLYRSAAGAMLDAQYIGSLVVENIKSRPKGEPSIELVIASSETGDIIADAIDLDTGAGGEHQILNVSLRSLDEANRELDMPDFELEHNGEPPSSLYKQAEAVRAGAKQFPWLLVVVIAGAVIVLALAALWFLFPSGRERPAQAASPAAEQPALIEPAAPEPAPEAPAPPPPPAAEPPAPPAPPPLIEAPAAPPPRPDVSARKRPAPPVASYKVPALIPRGGVSYTIRWGDTLWDISAAFYRNPWQYSRIARFNNIRNPDRIIAGRTIKIPPRN